MTKFNYSKAWKGKNAKAKRRRVYRAVKKGFNLAKKVASLASMVNAEKSRVDFTISSVLVGQYNQTAAAVASDASYIADITPIPSQGDTVTSRQSASIKLHSSFMKIQFYQEGNNAINPIRGNIWFFLVKGTPQVPATFKTNVFTPNPCLTGASYANLIYDYNCNLNPDYFGQYKILRRIPFTVQPSSVSASQVMIKDVIIPWKWFRGKGHHIRYNANTTTVTDGQIIMFIHVDNGNIGGTAGVANSGVPVTTTNSGLFMNYDIKHYYYDN